MDDDLVQYELDWPPDLLRRELHALTSHRYRPGTSEEIEQLLAEAFHTEAPVEDYRRLSAGGEWAGDPGPGKAWVRDLLDRVDRLREYREPGPVFAVRRRHPGRPTAPTRTLYEDIELLLHELRNGGYLDKQFPPPCVDDGTAAHEDDQEFGWDTALFDHIRAKISVLKLWPLPAGAWNDDLLYSLIEVYHDLVARPRRRWNHDFNDCGWHYENFDTAAGRRIYRRLVNRILERHGAEYRISDDGEDVGLVITTVDEARAELLDRASRSPSPGVAARVEHARALFRGRNATEHDKRSAVLTLVGILEERRELIRTEIGKKDEGALFQIANEFAVRHQRRGQQGDYDPAFLDWMFWWYLATIELTDRILDRQRSEAW